ncbi:hypothetical protein P154DRAFT_577296 [Amniculicola lignicola CBS 123094]|uniref:Uncharacterized protein n=1 Tax=Amniculicola lignicola CBS 123094 TaxID=1392246 RepID=A0A6A5WCI0_9PLEO|nr:hypothetical protein P154DRAFT_577296 [Amniculicola lignicola CBS 123094]
MSGDSCMAYRGASRGRVPFADASYDGLRRVTHSAPGSSTGATSPRAPDERGTTAVFNECFLFDWQPIAHRPAGGGLAGAGSKQVCTYRREHSKQHGRAGEERKTKSSATGPTAQKSWKWVMAVGLGRAGVWPLSHQSLVAEIAEHHHVERILVPAASQVGGAVHGAPSNGGAEWAEGGWNGAWRCV